MVQKYSDILHHLGCIKPVINSGIPCQAQQELAGFRNYIVQQHSNSSTHSIISLQLHLQYTH